MRTIHDAPLSSDGQVAQGLWTNEEHQRFINALRIYPEGPWRNVAELIGTRNAKQAQAHMQKCKEKLFRRIRELQQKIDDDHSSSDSDGLDTIRYRPQRTRHAATLGIQVVDPIPFTNEDADGRFSPMHFVDVNTGFELSLEESLDYLIKCFVEGD
ncbi:hypothetical protein THRCLA_03162 [Thraustotheca clavata]|uniref:Uncharacterized protein n=1 Tax=Thraustotheca clavata TaxID=74557 RepID=A0A1W0A301_9STRA|nr:hypothetical protein THRCLA_03162 [Thraustotheca clavata]